MNYYFASKKPSVLKMDGKPVKTLTDEPTRVELPSCDTVLEICPLAQFGGVAFTVDDGFLLNPPSPFTVTDLKGGFLIEFQPPLNLTFEVLGQARYSDMLCAVLCDGDCKLYIETPSEYYCKTLAVGNLSDLSVEFYRLFSNNVLIVKIGVSPCVLAVFAVENKVKFIQEIVCDEFSAQPFTTTQRHLDVARHQVQTVWEYSNGKLVVASKKISCATSFSESMLPKEVLPFAFCEELLVGGSVSNYLDPNLNKNADKLTGYLGEFIGVFPPPEFIDGEKVGLIYKKGTNKYLAKYLSVTLEHGKITNLQLEE